MEDMLTLYVRPYGPRVLQVCMDEISKQLFSDIREPAPMEPGHPQRQGICNIFLACEPLAGKRYDKVTNQRTQVDWAYFIQEIVDVHYPQAEKIVLVLDNLNTHTPIALYEVFPQQRCAGSWSNWKFTPPPNREARLNRAEIELSVMSQHPFSQPIGNRRICNSRAKAGSSGATSKLSA